MLSSVLKTERAIMVNIQIIRTFTKLREMMSEHESFNQKIGHPASRFKLENLEKRFDGQFKIVFDALHRIFIAEDDPKSEIGFRVDG